MEVAVGKRFRRDVDAVAVARLIADVFHYDVDIEPMGPGKCVLTARGKSQKLTYNGFSRSDVAEKFVKELIGE